MPLHQANALRSLDASSRRSLFTLLTAPNAEQCEIRGAYPRISQISVRGGSLLTTSRNLRIFCNAKRKHTRALAKIYLRACAQIKRTYKLSFIFLMFFLFCHPHPLSDNIKK